MTNKSYIKRRDKEDNLYEQLQKQSLDMIQQLSGNIWTDFNEHDPGITMLDALNYALLELDYAFEAPFEEYLTDPGKNELYYEKTGLLPPDEIFAAPIVTPEDYESLFMSVEGVRNCRVSFTENHRYTITIHTEEDARRETIRIEISARYHSHRNLCENLEEIRFEKITEEKRNATPKNEQPEYTAIPPKTIYPKKGYAYHTIQNEFPECYGIGERGLPSDVPMQRKVEALHLKAYLMIFDYLMSGTSQQLSEIRNLLELSDQIPDTFHAETDVPDPDRLLDKEKLKQSSVFDREEMTTQKKIFFDHLDILYGENTERYAKDRPLQFRADLIRRFPGFNTSRFRSFDLLDKSMKTMPGIKELVNALLGNRMTIEMSVINNFSRYNLKLITDEKFFDELQGIFSIEFLMEGYTEEWSRYDLSEIPDIPHNNNLKKYYRLLNQLNLFRHNILFEGFLKYGTDPDNFRCLYLHDQSGYLLLYKQPGWKDRINLGFFFDKQKLIEACNTLWDFVKKLNRESFSFYFVEHILLWEDEEDDDNDGDPSEECNKLTIVIPRWIDHFYSREDYFNIFEERLPAHLDTYCIWLDVEDMKTFEESYFKWRNAWAFNEPEQIKKYSHKIRKTIKNEE